MAESTQTSFPLKLILGASLKSLLLDFLIEVQTLEGEEQLCSHEEHRLGVGLCCPAAPGHPARPPCTRPSIGSSRTQLPGEEQRGHNTGYAGLARRARGQRSWPLELIPWRMERAPFSTRCGTVSEADVKDHPVDSAANQATARCGLLLQLNQVTLRSFSGQ